MKLIVFFLLILLLLVIIGMTLSRSVDAASGRKYGGSADSVVIYVSYPIGYDLSNEILTAIKTMELPPKIHVDQTKYKTTAALNAAIERVTRRFPVIVSGHRLEGRSDHHIHVCPGLSRAASDLSDIAASKSAILANMTNGNDSMWNKYWDDLVSMSISHFISDPNDLSRLLNDMIIS